MRNANCKYFTFGPDPLRFSTVSECPLTKQTKQTVSFALLSSGASACVELKQFEEAITWCDKGLAVSFDNML